MRMRRGSPPSMGGSRRRDAAAVDALRLVGRERLEHLLAFRVGQLVERELVVVADEIRPLAASGGSAGRDVSASTSGAASLRASDRYSACITEEVELQVELVAALAAEELQLLLVAAG